MAKARALIRTHAAASLELARMTIVLGCAAALILADRALPFVSGF